MEKTEDELLRIVTRVYAQAQRLQARCCGITTTQCQVLCAIGDEGTVPQAELSARLGLEKSWVSRAIDSLERDGLVERRKCCADARMYDVAFTEAGKARYEALEEALNSQAASVMASIPESERAGVRKALELLSVALSSMAATCRCGNP
ncbi:MAG: MarR family transcriptional regulator [Spirochaetae bacterium HGW-Spirochaetae-3]|jgi:DNA-binding MarR family transcriptional regulator|nr:MAG: MarR family transcriptional regulator [Spirochaetae bacterium HGW-Spirochaetae-3]